MVLQAEQVYDPFGPQIDDGQQGAVMGVDAYSPEQTIHVARLTPIKYCTKPEFYLEEASSDHIPQDVGEKDAAYEVRRTRALSTFEPYYSHLRDLIVGTALRKGVKTPDGLSQEWETFFKNVDLEGHSISSYGKKVFTEAIDGGCSAIWTEYPIVPDGLSAAEERRRGYRPYFVTIKNEDILEVRNEIKTIEIGGVRLTGRFPVYVRLKSTYVEPDPANEFVQKRYAAVRVYDLIKNEAGAEIVRWRLFAEMTEATGEYTKVKDGEMKIGYIPFSPCYGGDIEGYCLARPQLLDIARLNLHHWAVSADLAAQIHNTASPILAGTGIREDEDIVVSRDSIMTASNPEAKLFYISAGMEGAQATLDNLARIVAAMERLAAVAMTTGKTQSESGFSKLLDRAQSDSQLAVLIQTLEDSLNLAVMYAAGYMQQEAVPVTISRDFIPVKLHSQQVMAYLNVFEKDVIPIRTLLEILHAGEIFEGLVDFSIEQLLEDMGLDGTERYSQLAPEAQQRIGSLSPISGAATDEPQEVTQESAEADVSIGES